MPALTEPDRPTAPVAPGPGYERLRNLPHTQQALFEYHRRTRPRYAGHRRQQAMAYDALLRAFCGELLPTLLSGAWQYVGQPRPLRTGKRQPPTCLAVMARNDLFTPALLFRHAGARGEPTWDNGAVVGLPFDLRALCGYVSTQPKIVAADIAAALKQAAGIAMWVLEANSAPFPNDVSLVIAARGLPEDAAAYGMMRMP